MQSCLACAPLEYYPVAPGLAITPENENAASKQQRLREIISQQQVKAGLP